MKHNGGQGGFSLLEILVAFTIFTACLGIIFQVYSMGSRTAATGLEHATAALVARARAAETGVLLPCNSAAYRGTEKRKYHWVARVNPLPDETPDSAAQSRLVKCEVAVEVSWDAPGGRRALRVDTLKLRPRP